MNYVLCAGHERTLFECYNYWDYQSYYARDANVICYNNGEYIYIFLYLEKITSLAKDVNVNDIAETTVLFLPNKVLA